MPTVFKHLLCPCVRPSSCVCVCVCRAVSGGVCICVCARFVIFFRLSYAAKLVLTAVEGRHVESAVDLLFLRGGFVNPLSYQLYRQEEQPTTTAFTAKVDP